MKILAFLVLAAAITWLIARLDRHLTASRDAARAREAEADSTWRGPHL